VTTTDVQFVDALLAWGDAELRDLPWRRTRDPWAILVAETMLQQTQVARVVPRWEAFLAAMPTPAACAAAPVGEVLRLWDGLGYNRRAVNLHRAATVITEQHGGVVPDDLDALRALPGVGPYTARAVLAFALERDGHGVLDTNVARVLARAVSGRRLKPREAQDLADALVPSGAAWSWNQTVMELGARVCSKRAPRCMACPVASSCTWRLAGGPDGPDPADGTAGASTRQSRFEGSDRQGRGRLVAALRTGPIDVERIADVTGWGDDPDRASRIADGLVAHGLAEYADGVLALPA
jgi:A/G-specific adenine glycosylase